MPEQRPTLEDLAAAGAVQAGEGLSCLSCNCRDLRVVYTRRRGNRIMRRRQCRHCGRRVTTFERAEGGGPKTTDHRPLTTDQVTLV